LAERKLTSPEVLRSGRPLPIPSLLDYRHPPSADRSPPSRERARSGPRGTTTDKDLATIGRISFTTALGTRARLRARADPKLSASSDFSQYNFFVLILLYLHLLVTFYICFQQGSANLLEHSIQHLDEFNTDRERQSMSFRLREPGVSM